MKTKFLIKSKKNSRKPRKNHQGAKPRHSSGISAKIAVQHKNILQSKNLGYQKQCPDLYIADQKFWISKAMGWPILFVKYAVQTDAITPRSICAVVQNEIPI